MDGTKPDALGYQRGYAGHRPARMADASWRHVCLCCAAAFSLLAPGLALEINIQSINTTRIESGEVKVLSIIQDATGEPVKGLRRDSFGLEDEVLATSSRAPIESFTVRSVLASGEALGVVLLIDRSGSMKDKPLADAKAAAKEFLTRLSETDQAAVVSFGDSVNAEADFSSRTDELIAAIDTISQGGDTALYDAVVRGANMLGELEAVTRRAAILLTDGKCTIGACRDPEEAIAMAEASAVRVYTIGLGREPNHEVLRRLAEESGGRHFRAADSSDLLTIYQKIADRLQNDYVITFGATEDLSWHRLRVSVAYGGSAAADSYKYWPVNAEWGSGEVPADGPPSVFLWVVVAEGALCLLILALIVWATTRRRAAA